MCCVGSCSSLTNDGSVIDRPFSAVDANREIVLGPNRTFEIVLQSNPTTGYDWLLNITNTNVVHDSSHQYVPGSSNRVGVGGNTTWSLLTRDVGSTTLEFSYGRPWEKDTLPTRVVTFSITVR